jgi:uncharacterized protein (DUF488 family)
MDLVDGVVWSVGHSNHSMERFVELLRTHGIEVVADVRSSPHSRFTPHFSKDQVQRQLSLAGVRHVFLGAELGGRPAAEEMYEPDGRVRYDLVAGSPPFRAGLGRLVRGIEQFRVAVMCGEEDPISCHRRRLVGRVLAEEGCQMLHIRADGHVHTEVDLRALEASEFPERFQLGWLEETRWASIHSVRSRS